MTKDALLFIVSAAGAACLMGCDGDPPVDRGVLWQCTSDVSIKETRLIDIWNSDRRNNRVTYTICANPDVPVGEIKEECVQECEDHFSGLIEFMIGGAKCNEQGSCSPAGKWKLVNASATCSNTEGPFQSGRHCNEGDMLYSTEFYGQWTSALVAPSRIDLSARGESGTAALIGDVNYSILPDPRFERCPAEGCTIGLTRFALSSPGLNLGGKDITNLEAQSRGIIKGTRKSDGSVVFPAANFKVQTRFDYDGSQGSKEVTPARDVTGRIDPITNVLTLDPIALSIDELSATVFVNASLTAHPPEARITPQPTVECNTPQGASVTLSGTGSFDPDGDINGYTWYHLPPPGDARVLLGAGATQTTMAATFPMGLNYVGLFVLDHRAAFGFDEGSIRVVDTTPPALMAPSDVVKESCEPGGEAIDIGVPSLADTCDPNVQLTATIVDVNGVPANIPLTSGFAFKQGTTSIEYVVTDAAGNVSRARQNVTLDIGASCCPAEMRKVVGTPGDDRLEGSNGAQCLVGLAGNDQLLASNGTDMLIGGPGDDYLEGNNNIGTPEKHFGGAGNDVIDGGNGDDILWGGLGDDHVRGSNGKDILRGGPGVDILEGENGDDLFIIASRCEIKRGDVIDGGLGFHDRLETPLTLEQLQAMGVTVVDVEEIVVTAPRSDAECVD